MKTQFLFLIAICVYLLLEESCVSIEVGGQSHKLPGESDYIDPIGAQAGVIFHAADLNENISFRPEINLSMQGAKYTDVYVSGRVDLLYVNVPLVLRYQWKNGIFAEAGVQPGFLLSAKDKYDGETYDYKDQLKTMDFGIPIGAGYDINKQIGVGLRFIEGITNINQSDTKVHNRVLALRVTYSFK